MQRKNQFFCKTAIICGLACAAIYLTVRIICDSPYDMIHKLDSAELIPPMWIFNILWMIWGFLSGVAAGSLIQAISDGRIIGREEIFAYKGGLFFISCFFLSLIWYPLMFVNQSLFLSLCTALSSAICSVICACIWKRVNNSSCIVMSAHSIWLFYVFIVNFSVFVHN